MTTVYRSRLDNGIRIVTAEMPGVPSATLGIWVENGSRYESSAQSGISHFLEHLLFKGTDRRTAAQIAEEIDAVGGFINAFTGKEYTCYYTKVLGEHAGIAEDVLDGCLTVGPDRKRRLEVANVDLVRTVKQGID